MHLFFLGSWSIDFFIYTRPSDQNMWSSLIRFFVCLFTIIRSKVRILVDLFLLFAHNHLTKICGPLSFIFSFVCARPFDLELLSSLIYFFNLYTGFRPKLRIILTLSSILLLIMPIFCTQYWWQLYSYISYAILMAALSLYLVLYIPNSTALNGYRKSLPLVFENFKMKA